MPLLSASQCMLLPALEAMSQFPPWPGPAEQHWLQGSSKPCTPDIFVLTSPATCPHLLVPGQLHHPMLMCGL